MLESKYRTMKEVLKTLSLASVLCSQVSMTLYNQSAPDSSPQASENMTAVEGEDAIFRLTSQQTINYISAMMVSRCDIPPGPGQQIVWRRGTEVLSAGSTLLKPDPRYSVTSPGSLLTIKRLVREDGGELVCQVQTELGLREMKHVLAVQGRERCKL